MAVLQDTWSQFKSQLKARMTTGYVKTFKFNRTNVQLQPTQFPVVVAFPTSIDKEEFIAMPKQKVVNLIITLSGKVTGAGDSLENELLKMDEYLKNALEQDLQLSEKVTIVNIGQSRFQWLDDEVAETTFEVIVSTEKFTAGNR